MPAFTPSVRSWPSSRPRPTTPPSGCGRSTPVSLPTSPSSTGPTSPPASTPSAAPSPRSTATGSTTPSGGRCSPAIWYGDGRRAWIGKRCGRRPGRSSASTTSRASRPPPRRGSPRSARSTRSTCSGPRWRTIHRLEVFPRTGGDDLDGAETWIEVEGNGFLHNMVRIIAGSLVMVGCGRRRPEWMAEVVAARHRPAAGPTAPPQGLVLVSITIDPAKAIAPRQSAPPNAPPHDA